jgi:hypothetical protein
MAYYDDNFGRWNMEGTEDRQFYRSVQRRSVVKVCRGCERTVRILPHYAYCNSCADVIERGGEF